MSTVHKRQVVFMIFFTERLILLAVTTSSRCVWTTSVITRYSSASWSACPSCSWLPSCTWPPHRRKNLKSIRRRRAKKAERRTNECSWLYIVCIFGNERVEKRYCNCVAHNRETVRIIFSIINSVLWICRHFLPFIRFLWRTIIS